MKKHLTVNGRIACNGSVHEGKWDTASKDYYATCRRCLKSIRGGRQVSFLEPVGKYIIRVKQTHLKL